MNSVTRRADDRPRVVVSGCHSSPYSGAAVVHRALASRLGRHLSEADLVDDWRLHGSIGRRLVGTDLVSAADIAITTSTPLPIRAAAVTLPIVYDIRWRWTRGFVGRSYRAADLHLTARRSGELLTISQTVREQLRALRIDPPRGVTVLELGPGQMDGIEPPAVAEREPSIALIGAAPHKRNELAVALLADIPAVRSEYRIVAISVSSETKRLLQSTFDPAQLSILDGLAPHEMAATLSAVRSYLALTTSEGFGFPYMEAAYMGCDVIAPRQSVTTELLGETGVLLDGDAPTPEQLWVALSAWEADRVTSLQRRATSRSWDRTAEQVATLVRNRLTPA